MCSFQATKNPFYLHVGKDILSSLNLHTKSECGYATIHDVDDKSLEDRQESFFLSETCKYLYLLFDFDNPVNRLGEKYLFTTEGHVFPINDQLRKKIWQDELFSEDGEDDFFPTILTNSTRDRESSVPTDCPNLFRPDSAFNLPLEGRHLSQVFSQLGVDM